MDLTNPVLFFLYVFAGLFVVINPFSTASVFVVLTEDYTYAEQRQVIRGAVLASTIILFSFGIFGYYIFKFFGVTIGAFHVAAGIILISISLKMIEGEHKQLHESHFEAEDIMIVPLSIPFISGPGTISTVIVMVTSAEASIPRHLLVYAAIFLNMVIVYWVLRKSDFIKRIVKERGFRVINKLMGIILMTMAVQFIVNGLQTILPTLR